MTKKQYAILILAFLLGLCLTKLVTAQQIDGPEQAQAGTLATFEILPPQVADWTITSVETTERVFQTDTSTNRLYFATPQCGTYHIVAAIVVDGKPQVLAKTFFNGSGDEIKPLPPVPPVPPLPPTPLAEWVKTQLPVLVKSQNMATERLLVAQCFEQIIQKIDNDTIKTAQNARTQLQIALTMTLAFASDTAIDDWQAFLTALSQKMTGELGDKVNDIAAVKGVFQTVQFVLNQDSFKMNKIEQDDKTSQSTLSTQSCPSCQSYENRGSDIIQQPVLRTFRLFR